jgi:hypothetical protein
VCTGAATQKSLGVENKKKIGEIQKCLVLPGGEDSAKLFTAGEKCPASR